MLITIVHYRIHPLPFPVYYSCTVSSALPQRTTVVIPHSFVVINHSLSLLGWHTEATLQPTAITPPSLPLLPCFTRHLKCLQCCNWTVVLHWHYPAFTTTCGTVTTIFLPSGGLQSGARHVNVEISVLKLDV